MGWIDYYHLLAKYNGSLSKASKKELKEAARANPNDPQTAKKIAILKFSQDKEESRRETLRATNGIQSKA